MKARMEQLINGRFEYEVPGLLLSQEKLAFSVTPEEKFKGELQFAAEDRRRIKGMAYSSHRDCSLERKGFPENVLYCLTG